MVGHRYDLYAFVLLFGRKGDVGVYSVRTGGNDHRGAVNIEVFVGLLFGGVAVDHPVFAIGKIEGLIQVLLEQHVIDVVNTEFMDELLGDGIQL